MKRSKDHRINPRPLRKRLLKPAIFITLGIIVAFPRYVSYKGDGAGVFPPLKDPQCPRWV